MIRIINGLLDFLEDDKAIGRFHSGDCKRNLIALETECSGVIHLYEQRLDRDKKTFFPEPQLPLHFIGAYIIPAIGESNIFIEGKDSLLKNLEKRGLNTKGLKIYTESELKREIVSEIRTKIKEIVNNDPEKICDKYKEKYNNNLKSIKDSAKGEAKIEYLYNGVTNSDPYLSDYSETELYENHDIFYRYVMDKETSVLKEANKYIEDNLTYIAEELVYDIEIKKELDKLKNTKELEGLKKLIESLNEDIKTLVVTFKINENEITTKIKNVFGNRKYYIQPSSIINKNDREQIAEMLGNKYAISYESIISVSHGKNILFKK